MAWYHSICVRVATQRAKQESYSSTAAAKDVYWLYCRASISSVHSLPVRTRTRLNARPIIEGVTYLAIIICLALGSATAHGALLLLPKRTQSSVCRS